MLDQNPPLRGWAASLRDCEPPASRLNCQLRLPRRGTAAVEMALVLPLILLLAFAVADFGRVVHAYLVVSNAARCGAEYGSMHEFTAYTRSSWQAQIRSVIEGEMSGLQGFSATNLQSTCTTTTDGDG